MYNRIKKILFYIARSKYSSYFIGFSFRYLTALMPLEKVYENKYVLSFKHPVPFWSKHFLVVPKKRITSFSSLDLTNPEDQNLVIEIFRAIQLVASQQDLSSFTALVNGGTYQDVPQVHFHVASGAQMNGDSMYEERFAIPSNNSSVQQLGVAIFYKHPQPIRELHIVVTVSQDIHAFPSTNLENKLDQSAILDILLLCQRLIINEQLSRYTILVNHVFDNLDPKLTFHLVSGKKLQ
jgi:histidine triad (HIT) family protein